MKRALKLAAGIDWLNEQIGRIIQWFGLLMILIGVYNATVRYLGAFIGENLSSNAYLEAQWYLFGAMFMLGGGYALRHNVHVRVDVVYGRLGEKGKAWVELLGSLVFLLPFCLLLFYLSLDWVGRSWAINETSNNPGGLIRYPIKTVLPFAFALLALQGLSQVIKALAVLRGHRERLFDAPAERAEAETV
ncbi:TRAP transporter small permease subunit [Alkalilimnicola sp. S0819]|uniref:TRAP transporter small permease subunit n=1 Tax=Alkalilimnicola sp. S0819 TaxID=2613922 RepID=UPI001261D3AB|nr:TRAP transporter small permease subunit [Alkalilimnicola sp. S0819]KAB7624190.1 TRAP transporter small permease subunit [Alkalilimnicola sp. S0819]MPQ16445.1 TRAP transporter small permease subunit [Alkalilimnicola sp. S0819]